MKKFKDFLKEATMSDIPHEIDDQIHKLKDMRFELEETEKNWKLAGLDTKPLLDVITSINNLIENMYSNGAKLADQEVIKEDAHYFPKENINRLLKNSLYNWQCISSAQGYGLYETKIKDKSVRIAHDDDHPKFGGSDTVYMFDNGKQKEEKDFKDFNDAFKYAESLLNKIYKESNK